MLGLKLLSRVHKVLWDLAPDYLPLQAPPSQLSVHTQHSKNIWFLLFLTQPPFFSMILHNLSVLILNPYHYV